MLEIKRSYDAYCHQRFTIKTSDGSFRIFYGQDLSLYWSPIIPEFDDIEDEYKYIITKDDNKVYHIFDELYESIISGLPFKFFKYDNAENYIPYNDNGLVKNNVIEWHSDDYSYDAASAFMIEKDFENEKFLITFKKSKLITDDISPFFTFAVKVSTGECRYDPYNATFIDMYGKLSEYCENRGKTFSNKPWYKKGKVRKR